MLYAVMSGDETKTHDGTAGGGVKIASDSPYADDRGCWDFSGGACYVAFPDDGEDGNFDFGNGDFCLETYVKFTDSDNVGGRLISKLKNADISRTDWEWWVEAGTQECIFYYWDGSNNYASVSISVDVDTWYHLAVCRDGANLRFFQDGVQIGSTYDIGTDTINHTNKAVWLGQRENNAPATLTGYLCDVRIGKYARYTSNFTKPSSPLTIDGNTNLLFPSYGENGAGSATGHTLTTTSGMGVATTSPAGFDGSAYIDGSYPMSVPHSEELDLVSPATIEFFVRFDSLASGQTMLQKYIDDGGEFSWRISWNPADGLEFQSVVTGTGTYTLNQGSTDGWAIDTWYHVAITLGDGANTTTKLYRDAVEIASGATNADNSNGGNLYIGQEHDGSNVLDGYICNLRMDTGRTGGIVRTIAVPSGPYGD